MNRKEKDLFLELCRFKDADKRKLVELISQDAASPEVLGHLFYNRMAAVAYGVLQENKLLRETGRGCRTMSGRW